MDDFSKLSILDFDSTFQDEDLNAISSLSISECDRQAGDGRSLPPNILNKFMPHFPSSPSPLRQSVLVTDETDKMDIDPVELDKDQATGFLSEDEDEILDNKETETAEAEDDVVTSSGVNSAVVLKALLSPTSLGVAAATKTDDYSTSTEQSRNEEQNIYPVTEIKESHSFGLSESDVADLRQRSQYQPVQVAINNHHYYYPSSYMPYTEHHSEDPLKLPNPWSPTSKPASRGSYLFMSYLQLVLNSLTLLVIFSFLTLFMRAVKTDLRSAWQHTKDEMSYESSKCRVRYLANNCGPDTIVPALEEKCSEWEKCMNRNNDIFFRARSTITATLFGDIVNSFIEPLGWKTLLVILMGLIIWCFSSNFILGYARAKTYYNKQNDQKRLKN